MPVRSDAQDRPHLTVESYLRGKLGNEGLKTLKAAAVPKRRRRRRSPRKA